MPKATPASQDFVAIKDIKDGVVLLKTGQICSVLLASSINFALKSTDEQEAILHNFQSFLNTLDFSLQIYIQSRRLNIEPYLALLATREDQQDNDLMRIQLREYIDFIRNFTEEVDVMTKNFFLVIPYTPTALNLTKGITSFFSGNNAKSNAADLQFDVQRIQLEQRVAIVEQGLSRMGVKTVTLGNDDLVEFYYHIYNPTDPAGSAPISSN